MVVKAAVKIENSKGIKIDGCTFRDFDKAIEAVNSDVTIKNTRIEKSGVAVEAHNSDIVIQDSVLLDNVIDLAVDNSNVRVINTIADKVISDIQNTNLKNKKEIINLAAEAKNATKTKTKKKLFRQLLNTLKTIAEIASLLKTILEMAGVLSKNA